MSLVESIWLGTAEAGSFSDLIANLRKSSFSFDPEDADIVMIAIAGPVEQNVRSKPPMIDWGLDISSAGKDFGFKRCLLINDFIAQAFACRSPIREAAEKILSGSPDPAAATAVIGAGTGLGKAVTLPAAKGGYMALSSEGGHTNFPFTAGREFEYQNFLINERRDQYITANTVVSGRGLSYLHQFLTGRKLGPSEVVKEFPLYSETLEWASRFYARVCRNYVLETLAMVGLYITGGVTAKAPELLTHPAFEKEFRSSDTLADLLSKIPVYLIKDLVAVAPHLSIDRAIVLAEGSSVTIMVYSDHQAVFSADGQVPVGLADGDRVCVRASEHTAQFVRFQDPGYLYRNLTSHMNKNPATGGYR